MGLADNINVNDKLKAINFDHLRGLLTPNELVQLKIIQEAIERCKIVDNGSNFLNKSLFRFFVKNSCINFDGNTFQKEV